MTFLRHYPTSATGVLKHAYTNRSNSGKRYLPTHIHPHIHTYVHTYIHNACMHTSCIHTCLHTYIDTIGVLKRRIQGRGLGVVSDQRLAHAGRLLMEDELTLRQAGLQVYVYMRVHVHTHVCQYVCACVRVCMCMCASVYVPVY